MKKRTMTSDSHPSSSSSSPKKPKFITPTPTTTASAAASNFDKLDENLLYEVFKHADAKTLALASCVSKQWHHTAQDERLWELICTRHLNNSTSTSTSHSHSHSLNCASHQLRSVVLALGGFRRLHALYLSKTSPASSSVLPFHPRLLKPAKPWGKDEVNLSLSLLSIRFYEKMNSAHPRRQQ